jgi:hypothetical protein
MRPANAILPTRTAAAGCPRDPKGTASLDIQTKLTSARRGYVRVKIYPRAGEAVVSCMTRPRPADRSRKVEGAKDPHRCQQQAGRRAASTVRRYAAEHGLRYMITLTYGGGGERELRKVHRDVEKLIAKMVKDRNGRRFPYLWVPEYHADEQRFHVHLAVPFFCKHSKMMKTWSRGLVWCTDMKRPGECGIVGHRRAARYLSKYVTKTFDHSVFGRHRYERAQGFEPHSYQVAAYDLRDGEEYAEAAFRSRAAFTWRSSDVDDWQGPPCSVLFFLGRAPDG